MAHICGPGKRNELELPGLIINSKYVGSDWGDLLAAADLVVARAGSNTLFELLTLGKPNLLIPLPAKASRGDQIENAAYARRAGFSEVVQQQETGRRRFDGRGHHHAGGKGGLGARAGAVR